MKFFHNTFALLSSLYLSVARFNYLSHTTVDFPIFIRITSILQTHSTLSILLHPQFTGIYFRQVATGWDSLEIPQYFRTFSEAHSVAPGRSSFDQHPSPLWLRSPARNASSVTLHECYITKKTYQTSCHFLGIISHLNIIINRGHLFK